MTDEPEATVLEAARATGLLAAGRPVVVLLSGGRDSTCLLDVAVRLAGPEAVSALHLDYGLRPEAPADAAHCAALCARLGVGLEVREARRPAEAGGNLLAWARDARYAAAAEIAVRRGADIAAGHTATDQAETVLYRLASSAGRRALLGMAPRSGRIVRPLLAVSRAQTAAYCAARGLAWREDGSNADPRFARARIRHDILPVLRDIHPAAEANVGRTAALLRDEAAVLDAAVDGALDGRDEIALDRLAALPPALARLVLRRLAEAAAGGPAPRAAGRLPDVLALRGRSGPAALDLGDGARASVRRGVLRLEASPPRQARPPA